MIEIKEIRERILYDMESSEYLHNLHQTIKEGLIGSLRQEYFMSCIGEDKGKFSSFDKLMTPVFHVMVDMMTAHLLHATGKEYIERMTDTPTFKFIIEQLATIHNKG